MGSSILLVAPFTFSPQLSHQYYTMSHSSFMKNCFILTALIAMIWMPVALTQNPCPDGWEWNPNLSKCYYIIYTYTTWSEANVMCAALDPEGKATLTSIRSLEENDYILSLIPYVSWIGGTDTAEEGVWRWVEDNSLVDDSFTNWGQACPHDSESKNCMWSSGGGNIGTWFDESCTTIAYGICSKPIAAAGESSTLYPPLVSCPFECPAESGYFEVEPCGPFYCSCTNFDGYLQECPEGLVWHTDEDEFGKGECDYPFNDPDCAQNPCPDGWEWN